MQVKGSIVQIVLEFRHEKQVKHNKSISAMCIIRVESQRCSLLLLRLKLNIDMTDPQCLF